MREYLSPRLRCVANLVRQDAVLADVGTDHAYLPLFLLSVGHIDRAICSDINEGPLCSARENAREMGKSEYITFLLTNGLTGIMAHKPTDIAICGMGGELIAEILRCAPEAHQKGIRFLLQPMTRQEHLRATLFSLGFAIIREEYVTEGDKTYLIIVAEYSGVTHPFTETECLLGTRAHSDAPMTSAEKRYFQKKEKALLRRRDGRAKAGEGTEEEDLLLSYLTPYTKE